MHKFIVKLDNMDDDSERTIAVSVVPDVSDGTAWAMATMEALKMKQANELLVAVEFLYKQ